MIEEVDDDDLEAMLDACKEFEDSLTQWENEFIESIDAREPEEWTEKQVEKLQQIYRKVRDL